MGVDRFTGNKEVVEILSSLKADEDLQRPYSDVIDNMGHQYVDLVLEGGGVLGIALVGYTYILEQMGFRFRGIAGTSAGAINALLLAAIKTPVQPKSEDLLQYLSDQDLSEFIDGPFRVQKFVDALINGESKLRRIFYGALCYNHFRYNLGLNPGHRFKKWIAGILDDHDVDTTEKLIAKFTLPDHIRIRNSVVHSSIKGLKSTLVMIASDVTTETRVKFPEMARLYWNQPKEVHPAEYVRASMSIPGFFFPQRARWKGENTPERRINWEKDVRFEGEPPKEALFVDGGIVSNFPIDVFHTTGVPRLPTFGIKLGSHRDHVKDVEKLGQFGLALFNTSRHIHDYEFILRHPDYSHLVEEIKIGSHNWLNFSLPEEDQIDLFRRGAQAAANFLRKFNWEAYKEIRK